MLHFISPAAQIVVAKDKVLCGAPKRTEKITFVMIIYFVRGFIRALKALFLRFKLASNFYFHFFSFIFSWRSQLQDGIYLKLNHRNWLSTLESIGVVSLQNDAFTSTKKCYTTLIHKISWGVRHIYFEYTYFFSPFLSFLDFILFCSFSVWLCDLVSLTEHCLQYFFMSNKMTPAIQRVRHTQRTK